MISLFLKYFSPDLDMVGSSWTPYHLGHSSNVFSPRGCPWPLWLRGSWSWDPLYPTAQLYFSPVTYHCLKLSLNLFLHLCTDCLFLEYLTQESGPLSSVLFPTIPLEFRIVPGTQWELIFVGYEIHICGINKWRVVEFWVGYFSSAGYLNDETKEIGGWFATFGNNWLFSSLRDQFPWPLFHYIDKNNYFLPKE